MLIDADWDQWEDASQQVQALVAQADAVGVRLLLWYNSGGPHTVAPLETPLNRMLEPDRRNEMEKISGWGITGIKIDFFNSDKQDRIDQYIGILEHAKDVQLLVNFHGATIPRGWQRTYPHPMTHEAVNGAEQYKFAGVGGAPTAVMNVQDVLLRNFLGSIDCTPVVFQSALARVGLPYAHSLAFAVLFESGIQHFADRADSDMQAGYRAVFGAYPYVGDLLSSVPVAWDKTRLVDADIDDHVFLARRSGSDWYLAGIHASETAAEYTPTLDFLAPGTYELAWIEQGESDKQLRDEAMTLIFAGHETTAHALTWTWYLMAKNPDKVAKMREELTRVLGGRNAMVEDFPNLPSLEMVVKESLRLLPSAWAYARQAQRALVIEGYEIQKGQTITISHIAMRRNPKYYESPEEFRPERWTREFERSLPRGAYTPFAGGPRVCLGKQFAMMEMRMILATLVQRLKPNLAEGFEPDFVTELSMHPGQRGMQAEVRFHDSAATSL